jgi:hypothetical protein
VQKPKPTCVVVGLQWETNNVAWTDSGSSAKSVVCQQEPIGLLPTNWLGGGWISYEGEIRARMGEGIAL